jgi:multidrug efflux pump subunit AcrA (membrane-fusion protein)
MPPKTPPDTSRLVRSPMPGLIVSVAVTAGQEVKVGQELCVLEAMKMENVLRAERDGAVAEVNGRRPRHGRGRPDPADLRVTSASAPTGAVAALAASRAG